MNINGSLVEDIHTSLHLGVCVCVLEEDILYDRCIIKVNTLIFSVISSVLVTILSSVLFHPKGYHQSTRKSVVFGMLN